MKLLDALFTSPAVQILGWALMHSLWQGMILAILLKCALNLSSRISSNTRYLLACVTLSLMALLPVSTALWSGSGIRFINSGKPAIQAARTDEKVASPHETSALAFISEAVPSYKSRLEMAAQDFMPWFVLIWSFGVLISLLKLIGVWAYTRHLRQIAKHLILESCRESLERLCRQLQVSRPVMLLESSLVKVPTVVGWLKPVILVPACALTGLTSQQFELILAHELAHIRRHDYLVNLFQTVIETLLFYHPAVWWVSGRIRNERENACDDLAVGLGGDALEYARTLIEMERLRKNTLKLAMAADGGSLSDRIHRLIGAEMSHTKRFAGLWAAVFISIFLIVAGVSKQSYSAIKESLNDALAIKSPFIKNPESDGSITEISKLPVAGKTPGSKKLEEELAKITLNSESETDLNFKPDDKQDSSFVEQNINQEVANAASKMTESFPENLQVKENVREEIVTKVNEIIDTPANIKYQPESKSQITSGAAEDFIEEMASVGYTNLSADELIKLKSVGVTAGYVRDLQAVGFSHLPLKELAAMRDEGVTRAYIEAIRSAGYKELTAKQFSSFKDLGITPELISKYRSIGYDNLSVKDLASFSDYRITTDFISSMNALGFGKLSPKDIISLRDYKITPEFARAARNRFGNDLTLKQVIELKRNGNS